MTHYLTYRPAPSRRLFVRGQSLVVDAVNTILWLHWDPIGCGVPIDEYRHVAEDLVDIGAEYESVAGHLYRYQRDAIRCRWVNPEKIAAVAVRVIEAMSKLPNPPLNETLGSPGDD